MKKVTRQELMNMNADDLVRTFQTSEEVCSFTNNRPRRLANFQIGASKKIDDELSDHIDSLLDSRCAYYIDEVNKGFETNADLTELMIRLKAEPMLVHTHTWYKVADYQNTEKLKYVHKYFVAIVLEAFSYVTQHGTSSLENPIVENR